MTEFKFNLQLFAEGGDGAGAEGGSTAEGALATQEGNSLEYVQYGKTEAPAEPAAADAGKGSEDADAQFKALIKGQYKEQYGKSVESAIMNRMKGVQAKVDKYDQAAPIFEALARKYGVEDTGDIAALSKAIDEDNSYYEDEALEKGLSVEQVKAIHKMERENAALREQMRQKDVKDQADKIYAKWMKDGERVKGIYPQFDLQAELGNSDFADMLRAGVNVQAAYEVVHKDEILSGAMRYAVQQSEQKLANKVKANGTRPNESALNRSSSAVVKADVNSLSYDDMDEVIRRAARGERIVF